MQPRTSAPLSLLPRIALALAVLLPLLGTTGCSTYQREWRAAAAAPVAPGSIEGAWDGMWLSDHNGHNGRLQAILTKVDADTYEARFKARYMTILSFSQTTLLKARPGTGRLEFAGENDLGKAYGGIYTYAGHATDAEFFSTYKCSIDHGKFELKRPKRK